MVLRLDGFHHVLRRNHKYWKDYLTHIELAYNQVVHKTTKISPFENIYGFNPLISLDFILLPNVHDFIHKEGVSKAKFVKYLRNKVKTQIQDQTKRYTKYNNKGKKVVIFEEGN